MKEEKQREEKSVREWQQKAEGYMNKVRDREGTLAGLQRDYADKETRLNREVDSLKDTL